MFLFQGRVGNIMANKNTGSVWVLQWSDIISNTVKIEYTTNSVDYNTIALSATNHNGPEFGQGYYNWLINISPTNNVIVRISDNDYSDMYVEFDPVNIVSGYKYLKVNGSSSNRGMCLGINRGFLV